jgi:hypothetical protein
VKAARTVRRGAVGKVPQISCGNSLAAYGLPAALLYDLIKRGELTAVQPSRALNKDKRVGPGLVAASLAFATISEERRSRSRTRWRAAISGDGDGWPEDGGGVVPLVREDE